MGQRLVFECMRSGHRIATLYFHWSGYTDSIYETGMTLVNALREKGYNRDMTDDETKVMLLDILEHWFVSKRYLWEVKEEHDENWSPFTHGGIGGGEKNLEDIQFFKDHGYTPEPYNVSRSDGLIEISEKEMNNALVWAEELEVFNFDAETFSNNEFFYTPKSEVLEEWDYTEEELSEVPIITLPSKYTETIAWDDATDATKWFRSLKRYNGFLGKTEDDYYISVTE